MRALTLLLAPVMAAAAAVPASAQYAYFTSQTNVQRALLDGSNAEVIVKDQIWPLAIALDVAGEKVYWTDASRPQILRANLDGSEVEPLVSTGISFPAGLALDLSEGKMYWGDRDYPGVSRSNLDGSEVELLVPGVSALGVALDLGAGKIYWTEEQLKIGRSNLDGREAETVIGDLGSPNAIALDVEAGMLYATDEGPPKIIRAPLDGGNWEVLMTDVEINPFGIALDTGEGKIYWTDLATGIARRANLDGTEAEDIFPAVWSFGIALDLAAGPPRATFRRGDVNGDGTEDITDPIVFLTFLFQAGDALPCPDAADANDDGVLDISDPIEILGYLYQAGEEPPAPGPRVCGPDPTTGDSLGPCPGACR